MDGVLVIDKPQGLTSHDVVAVARRLLGEARVGHTGTLDPLATGVLPLALGRATRLARFLSASDKDYEATIRFGLTTDSYDITGAETGRTDAAPSRDEVLGALDSLRGDYLQTPPAYSAKRVEGRRSYDLARRDEAVALAPAPVRVARAELLEVAGAQARVAITCSAGFYVRSFAHALGETVGTGACLETLRRTRSGEFGLDAAVSLEELQDSRVLASVIPLEELLPGFPAVSVTDHGRAFVSHGRVIGSGDYISQSGAGLDGPPRGPQGSAPRWPGAEWVRIFDSGGALVALGTKGQAPDSLHPAVVLI